MKTIKQEDKSGCGIACVAMVAGCSYSHAKTVWLSDAETSEESDRREWRLNSAGDGMDWYEVCGLLGLLNANIPKCWEVPRIISIRASKEFKWLRHWVVVDDFGNILNPA